MDIISNLLVLDTGFCPGLSSLVIPVRSSDASDRILGFRVRKIPIEHADLVAVVNHAHTGQNDRQYGKLIGLFFAKSGSCATIVMIIDHPIRDVHWIVRYIVHSAIDETFEVGRA